MIEQTLGRWRSFPSVKEFSDDVADLISRLDDDELKCVEQILNDMESEQHSPLADQVAELEWEETPVPITDWLEEPDLIGDTGETLFPVLKRDLIELFEGNYHEVILCLHPETRVPLLDGTAPTIFELARRWETNAMPFWVYSHVNGEIVPAQAIQPRQTGVDDYYRVTMDDGSSFVGNARHQMLRRNGEKVMIREMSPGDSLMPFEVKFSTKEDGDRIEGYEKLKLLTGEWAFTHRLVAKGLAKEDGDEDTIHHVDFHKTNNTPMNLRWMRWRDHIALHALLYAEWRAANPEAAAAKDAEHAAHLSSLWDGEDGEERRREHAERLRQMNLEGLASVAGKVAWTNRSEAAKAAFSAMMATRNAELAQVRRTDVTLEAIQACGAPNMRKAAQILGCSASRVHKAIRDAGMTPKEVFGPSYGRGRKNKINPDRPVGLKPKLTVVDIEQAISSGAATTRAAALKLGVNKKTIYNTLKREGLVWADLCELVGNHYVVSVEKVGHGPVYCLSVPRAGNFAISTGKEGNPTRSGVFSSNTGAIGWG